MLKSVDILIGFSVIMLVVSMSVTLIIQWIMHLLKRRGKELLKGLTALMQQIDSDLQEHAEEIATQILSHPMLAHPGKGLAEVVHREELIKIVLELAASPPKSPPGPTEALTKALANMGIPDPGEKLDAIRLCAMRLEASQPELATHVREAQAVITVAGSQFVAKVNGWFDPTMDCVSQSFATRSHYWTAGVSLLLALLLQIDAFKIVNRLAMDDTLRASLVGVGSKVSPPQGSDATPAPPPGATDDEKARFEQLQKDTQINLEQLRNLASDKLITWPMWPSGKKFGDNWNQFWSTWWAAWDQSTVSLFGVLLSAALLSFGAPFWFNVLGDLLKLRPALAAKDDQQRQDRESSQKPADGGGSPP